MRFSWTKEIVKLLLLRVHLNSNKWKKKSPHTRYHIVSWTRVIHSFILENQFIFFYLPTNSCLFCDAAKYCNLGNPKFPGFTGVFLKFKALCLRIAWCVADTGRVVIRLTVQLWIMCAFFLFFIRLWWEISRAKNSISFYNKLNSSNWIGFYFVSYLRVLSSLSCTFERNTGEVLNVL